jgi:hypothetical protein
VERNCGLTNRHQIRGGTGQGERAYDREAVVTKARGRKSGGGAVKVNVLTRGDLALRLKGRRGLQDQRSEKSAQAVVAVQAREGPNGGEGERPMRLGEVMPQKLDENPSVETARAVKPQGSPLRVEASPVGSGNGSLGSSELMEGVRTPEPSGRTEACATECGQSRHRWNDG